MPAALAGGGNTSTVEGETLDEVFAHHASEYGSELRDSVVEAGEIKAFINVFVDGSEAESIDAVVGPDSQVSVVPAASGG